MSDVSAVVLTVGESYLHRALASLAEQTLPLAQVIVVENVSPFSAAMNQGARQVQTAFFVQVDADMILDPHCVEVLRGAMGSNSGMAVGELRDPLVGQRVGIKLFRTECFQGGGFPDRISPDTDFVAAIRRRGWRIEQVGLPEAGSSMRPATLGEHRPDYSPGYTFRKYLLEGRRLRYRAAPGGMRWQFGQLEASDHPLATLAQLALAHGFFLAGERDELKPDFASEEPEAADLLRFLELESQVPSGPPLGRVNPGARLRETFSQFIEAGRSVRKAGAGATAREIWSGLQGAGRDWHRLVAKLGFGHGLLSPTGVPDDRQEEAAVEVFLTLWGRATRWRWAMPAVRVARRIPGLGNGLWRRW